MNVNRRTQAERREATRTALVAAARELFAERGYAGVGTEEIVQRAGVTRGALYHHFSGKHDLFRAVYERVEQELTERIVTEVPLAGDDPVAVLRGGTSVFLDACLEPEVQRIALLDAPAVLGYDEWRAIGERYGLGLIHAAVQRAVDVGAIAPQPVRPLAHVLLGALDEAALLIARADDVATARREVGETLDFLLSALTAPGSSPAPPSARPR
jgi:AcrR family transcriptional regulator